MLSRIVQQLKAEQIILNHKSYTSSYGNSYNSLFILIKNLTILVS